MFPYLAFNRTVSFLVASLFVAAAASAQSDGVSLEDVFTVRGLGGVAVAPDGNRVLYTVTTADLEENETNSDVWMLVRDGQSWGDPIQMTTASENDANPKWRSDGGAFAFLSGRDEERNGAKGQRLFLMRPSGGEAALLYGHKTSIGNFQWSPDGAHIAFVAADEPTAQDKESEELGRDVVVEEDDLRFTHLWILDVAGKVARRVTEGREFTVGAFQWSPDGERIAFSATPTNLPTDSWRSDIYVTPAFDLNGSVQRVTDNIGPDQNPVWTPDGQGLIVQTHETDRSAVGYTRARLIRLDGSTPEDVSPLLDVQAGTYELTNDGRSAFFSATDHTTRALFFVTLASRETFRVTPDEAVYGSFSFSADFRTVAYVYEDPNTPAEIYVSSLRSRPRPGSVTATTPLTNHNSHTASWTLGRTEVLRWAGSDGRPVEGIVVYPTDWEPGSSPRATVVKIHGGPSGVYVQNFQAASSSSDAQRYAGDGYVVLLPNPRGSSGYGEEGLRSVVTDWGGLDFQDIMAGVDTLVARGVAHEDSLGVMGWSYGGYMTAWTVTQTDRFKAAVAGAAITENIAMWGTQDIVHVFEAYFGGGPYEPGQWEIYQRSNPLAFIERAVTPTLILHGQNDERVPPNQARIFYRALKANGVDTELVWLPRTGHGPREPGLRYETARRQKEWMDRWIRGAQRDSTETAGIS
ncbi:MAG: S9 family peptidase [Gemmatimonadota bacterium]|nr:S9 family peptidase [Gemmatimonadota bacterium]